MVPRNRTSRNIFVEFLHVIIYFLLFTPQYIKTVPYLDIIFNYSKIIILVYAIGIALLLRRFNYVLTNSLLIFAVVVFSTRIHGDSVSSVIGRYYSMIGALFFFEIHRNNLKREVNNAYSASEIIVFVNFITMILYPKGLYIGTNHAPYWFAGQKQDFAIVYLVSFVFGCILWNKRRMRKRITFTFLAMGISMVFSVPLGLVLCLAVIGIMLYISRAREIYIQGRFLYRVNLLGEVFILFLTGIYSRLFQLQLLLSRITLGGGTTKADNMASRVNMWLDSIEIIRRSPIIGIGYISIDRYYSVTKHSSYHPIMHNMLLDLGVTGGIISILLFISINVVVFEKLDKYSGTNRNILAFSLFAINILMLTECMYWPFTLVFYCVAYNIDRLEPGSSRRNSLKKIGPKQQRKVGHKPLGRLRRIPRKYRRKRSKLRRPLVPHGFGQNPAG